MIAALAVAAALAALPVASDPPGATASVRYLDRGDVRDASCVTPCSLSIPRGAPFALQVMKDGQAFTKSPIRWCYHGLAFAPSLCPGSVQAVRP